MTATLDPNRTSPRPLRADARRNQRKLREAARVAFAEHGAEASLDEIARRAGVGIGTLYRHFPSRWALLDAILGDDIAALCAEADDLLLSAGPVEALTAWMRAVALHAATYQGLAAALLRVDGETGVPHCSHGEPLRAAGHRLLARAQADGAIRPDVTVADLFAICNGLVWATEQAPGGPAWADRLLGIMLDGLRAPPPAP